MSRLLAGFFCHRSNRHRDKTRAKLPPADRPVRLDVPRALAALDIETRELVSMASHVAQMRRWVLSRADGHRQRGMIAAAEELDGLARHLMSVGMRLDYHANELTDPLPAPAGNARAPEAFR